MYHQWLAISPTVSNPQLPIDGIRGRINAKIGIHSSLFLLAVVCHCGDAWGLAHVIHCRIEGLGCMRMAMSEGNMLKTKQRDLIGYIRAGDIGLARAFLRANPEAAGLRRPWSKLAGLEESARAPLSSRSGLERLGTRLPGSSCADTRKTPCRSGYGRQFEDYLSQVASR